MENQNPYAPPTAEIETPLAPVTGDQLASRWRRLWGAVIDSLFTGLSTIPAYTTVSFATLAQASNVDKSPFLLYRLAGRAGVVSAILLVIFNAVNWILLTRRGQTVGKMFVGTRVVRLDGTRAPFVKVVAIRSWPVQVLGFLPRLNRFVFPALMLIDVLFIFRRDRRCLHDLMAGTKVIRLK